MQNPAAARVARDNEWIPFHEVDLIEIIPKHSSGFCGNVEVEVKRQRGGCLWLKRLRQAQGQALTVERVSRQRVVIL